MINPYGGPDAPPEPLTGRALEIEIEFYRRSADRRGEPHDPEWDRWLEEDRDDQRRTGP